MKILHTADWHLGKILHSYDMEPEHLYFLDRLMDILVSEKVDYLLLAGDVFDHNNPSNDARKLYYRFLTRCAEAHVKVIITGGNHDSANMLQVSKELLAILNINIVGAITDNIYDEIIPLTSAVGNVEAICAAVPFLRERDLRNFTPGESTQDRIDSIKESVVSHYKKVKNAIMAKYGEAYPIIATGHLYLQGSTLSEADRDIQLGHTAGIDAALFKDMFDYMALGHIHNAHRYATTVRYSGSPIPLSFSESTDDKCVIMVEVQDGVVSSRSIPIPQKRALQRVEGNIDEVSSIIDCLVIGSEYSPLIEAVVHTDESQMLTVSDTLKSYSDDGHIILVKKIKTNSTALSDRKTIIQHSITDLDPAIIFKKKLMQDAHDESLHEKLWLLHNTLLAEIYEEEND
jgi:DNA repair protein SbcD/Mre11